MEQVIDQKEAGFVDRRRQDSGRNAGPERRQFRNNYGNDRPEVAELGEAIDQYKMMHRRRFITFEELYGVIEGLGYHK
ncbi:hypothetical protein [Stratiformator vulcanicus]|uniref:Uncharacterized protein n=1 Tax=Stratiformator vulcanicus TaxID=2527980 RepID=A0A517QXK0_9PLAN|nr:hypothetical protein [Stratiformator vulcanicus]QDT36386.1 hypothetical protein Pan189_07420 [Stratiformator vulcanicus]